MIVSNWGAMDEETLQRNGILFDMVYTSLLLWNRKLDESYYVRMRDWTLAELFNARCRERFSAAEAGCLEIVHTTNEYRPFKHFADGYFVDDNQFLLGHHVVHFSNGKTLSVPVVYGSNIFSEALKWELAESNDCDSPTLDPHLPEVSFGTLPFNKNERTFYRIRIENPFPGEDIVRVEFRKAGSSDCRVDLISCRAIAPLGEFSSPGVPAGAKIE